MKTLILKIFCLICVLALVACSSGSGGNNNGQNAGKTNLSSPIADITGDWNVTENGSGNCQGNEQFTDNYTVTVAQSGNDLDVTAPAGDFTGVISGNQVSWTGTYSQDGGTVSIKKMELALNNTADGFSGSSVWSWTDGSMSCSGTTVITGEFAPAKSGTAPAAASNVSSSNVTTSSVELTWTDNSDNETQFAILRRDDSTSQFSQIGFVSQNVTSFVDTNLKPDTTYYYIVQADNQSGSTNSFTTITITTLPVTSGLVAPTNFSIGDVTSSSIVVSWNDTNVNDTSYVLERSTSATTGFVIAYQGPASSGVSIADYSLQAATTYYYRVKVVGSNGESDYSSTISATTLAVSQAPLTPTNLNGTATSSTTIELSWDDVATTEVSYLVEYAIPGILNFKLLDTLPANTSSYTVSSLTASTTYNFRVRAVDADGLYSDYSNIVSTMTLAQIDLPAAPVNIAASNITASSAQVSWTDVADNETGYEVGLCTAVVMIDANGNKTCTRGFQALGQTAANQTAYTLTGLTADSPYQIFVRAFNDSGVSANRNVDFTTLQAAPVQQTISIPVTYGNTVIISSDDPTKQTSVIPDDGLLSVGCNWDYQSLTATQSFVCAQSVLKFDLNKLTNSTIVSATLRLKVDHAGVGIDPQNWTVSPLASPWSTSTITWDKLMIMNYYNTASIMESPPSYSGQIIDVDVTQIVQNWANGTWANNGFVFGLVDYPFPYATSLDAFAFVKAATGTGDQVTGLFVTYQ